MCLAENQLTVGVIRTAIAQILPLRRYSLTSTCPVVEKVLHVVGVTV